MTCSATRSRRAPAAGVAALLAGGLVAGLAGCGDAAPHRAGYTFSAQKAAARVDTPRLRALKAAARIDPCPAASAKVATGAAALPDLTLPCLGGGRPVDLARLRGPLLLNFWAQTCGPCQQESPILQRFSQQAAGRVQVLGVDFLDPRPEAALAFAKRLGLTYPQVADPDGAARGPLRVSGLPMTFFVDANGRTAFTQVGAVDTLSQLRALVHEHLGVAAAAS